MFLDVALVPLVIFLAIGYEQYLLSAVFGLLFAALADPGGGFVYRASRIGVLRPRPSTSASRWRCCC
jgi:hypothetical protein